MIAAMLAAAATWLLVPRGPDLTRAPSGLTDRQRDGVRDAVLVIAVLLSLGPVAAGVAAVLLRAVLPRLALAAQDQDALEVADVIVAADYLAVCASAGLTTVESVERLAQASAGRPSLWAAGVVARHRAGMPLGEALTAFGHPSATEMCRVLNRAHVTGAPIGKRLRRHSRALQRERRDALLAQVRSLGVRAVAPLGLCFLPAFILLAVVPLAASFATQLSW